MRRDEREYLEGRRWWKSGGFNSWWERAKERGWGWEAEDTHYDCLADMVDRISELEDEVERLKKK